MSKGLDVHKVVPARSWSAETTQIPRVKRRTLVLPLSHLWKGKKYEVACINSPDDTVLSGKNEEIQTVQRFLAGEKVKTTTLKVPYAFHSSRVNPILIDLEKCAQGAAFQRPNVPVLCPLHAKVIKEASTYGPSYLSAHCRQFVNILGAIKSTS